MVWPRMGWSFVLGVVLSMPVLVWADSPSGSVDELENGIRSASELGNFSRVQALRSQLADLYVSHQQYAEAAGQYELLLASRPPRHERVDDFIKLGHMRRALENYSGAISAYDDALHDEPKNWDANFYMAQVYAQTDLNARAIAQFNRCIQLRPENPDAYAGLGAVYQHLGYLTRAVHEYQKANALDPRPEIYMAMADTYVSAGDLAHAAEILQQGKSALPQAEYDVRLGDIYRKLGDLPKAAAAWELALAANPKRDDVAIKLAMVYDALHRPDDTDREMKRLEATYPDSPLVHFLHAWVFLARGDRSAARREAFKVKTLEPTELVQHYNDLLLTELERKQ